MSQARADQITTLASAYGVDPSRFATMDQAELDKAWLAIVRIVVPV